MVTATGIYKSFGPLQVLKGVDLQVNPAEVVSIVGASGAGKSTLLHIIGTLDKPDKGDVILNDVSVKSLSEKQLSAFRNKLIGFVFQFHHLLPEFTALENVCIPGYIAGRKESEVEARAKELLEYLRVSDRMQHKPNQMSGGEQQRVAVARALINQPAVILADEPSGNLDTQTAKELHELFFQLRDTFKQTFIIVTHNTELADMADRKLVMQDGQMVLG
ncbi:MAG TPA: ABC transporter ATP-binding protein [Chitinophagales bacterium]|nr:ABC transporter ATP-binding protein [Chitinophagales bacterium]HMU70721.1 ABC transporter ATP-binding protein [Chitinophagales bacterium]HMX04297.1 ABC transporter ATP-binding protein [Chitinophagales bacterium]HNA59420.1 ABC transporter ATP-binding protein [Chitinophagales bacterium]HNE46430.1 ABC transporter ATP-binding protein [Chitinophagales bacterium]